MQITEGIQIILAQGGFINLASEIYVPYITFGFAMFIFKFHAKFAAVQHSKSIFECYLGSRSI